MGKKQLFSVAAILHPEKNDKGIEIEDSKLIMEPTNMMAQNATIAGQLVIRKLDEEYVDKLDRVDVLVRPF